MEWRLEWRWSEDGVKMEWRWSEVGQRLHSKFTPGVNLKWSWTSTSDHYFSPAVITCCMDIIFLVKSLHSKFTPRVNLEWSWTSRYHHYFSSAVIEWCLTMQFFSVWPLRHLDRMPRLAWTLVHSSVMRAQALLWGVHCLYKSVSYKTLREWGHLGPNLEWS